MTGEVRPMVVNFGWDPSTKCARLFINGR